MPSTQKGLHNHNNIMSVCLQVCCCPRVAQLNIKQLVLASAFCKTPKEPQVCVCVCVFVCLFFWGYF